MSSHYDVAILGGGLAGLTLARHLSLATDRRVALIERRADPRPRPKVGESTVQVAGYYFSRVLDLERELFDDHYLKYNLRFYWPEAGGDGSDFADFSQCYIRTFSNICSFQIDRTRFEERLEERLRDEDSVTFIGPTDRLEVELCEGAEPHRVSFHTEDGDQTLEATWVVDATGRRKLLQRQLELQRESPIRHGASFLWVDGHVEIERLTRQTPDQVRLSQRRRTIGHTPLWMATNHFCGEGWWLWVIPLRGKTSIGLVFDSELIDFSSVSSGPRLLDWIDENLPLFTTDLRSREVVHHAGFKDFAYDARLTLSPDGWAMTGEAGRFSDPLYSPGSDLISFHNTLIVDAIRTPAKDLPATCRRSETLLKALYEGYVASYAESYDALGDPEAFALKYGWELSVYFGFYVFPFVNDLFTNPRFVVFFLRRFARLGALNRGLQTLLSDYFQWKKSRGRIGGPVVDFELTRLAALARAEKAFYRIGVDADEGRRELDHQLRQLEELARFTAARVAAVVLDRPEALTDAGFVDALDLESPSADPETLRGRWEEHADGRPHSWSFDPDVLADFDPPGWHARKEASA